MYESMGAIDLELADNCAVVETDCHAFKNFATCLDPGGKATLYSWYKGPKADKQSYLRTGQHERGLIYGNVLVENRANCSVSACIARAA